MEVINQAMIFVVRKGLVLLTTSQIDPKEGAPTTLARGKELLILRGNHLTDEQDPLITGEQGPLLIDGRDLLLEGGLDPPMTSVPDPTERILMTEEKGLPSVTGGRGPEAGTTRGVFHLCPKQPQVNKSFESTNVKL